MEIKNHLEMLGFKAKEKVTGMTGVIDSIAFDLYGCVQASLRPPIDEDGNFPDGRWFDIARLQRTGKKRVMPLPNFNFGLVAEGNHGPADKAPKHDKKS